MTREHEGRVYQSIQDLESLEKSRIEHGYDSLDLSKIKSLYVCCYKYGEFIEQDYLNTLREQWKIS